MADLLIDQQGEPTTPASGQSVVYLDTTTGVLINKDSTGKNSGRAVRTSTAAQGPGFAVDTYVTDSGLRIPSFGMKAGMIFEWKISVSKTAASTVAPVYQVRIGANQSTADTSRLSMTAALAQSAALDRGIITVLVTVRSVSATGVIEGVVSISRDSTGAAGLGGGQVGTSAAFDNTALAGQYVGLSINGGTSSAWTITQVLGRIYY